MEMKISDGQFKMYAFFNDKKGNALGVFDLAVADGKPYVLVGYLPTTAGKEKVWQRLDASQLQAIKTPDVDYLYQRSVRLPATLGDLWRELYGHVRPFVHTEGRGMRFVAAGNTVYYSDPKGIHDGFFEVVGGASSGP